MSSEGKVPEGVLRCVAALKGAKSDNDRFAALFVVTKLIKADDCNQQCLKLLYDAIGFDFLNRLLKSTEVPQDCPPFIYKSIALSIVSCFCSVPEIVQSHSIVGTIPILLDIVCMSDTDDMEENLMLVSDCYTCLQAIARFEAGRKALVEKDAHARLAEIYIDEMFRHDEALKLLVYLAGNQGKQMWNGRESLFKELMTRLANDFNGETSERKFELCKMLAIFMTNRPSLTVEDLENEDWPRNTLLALESILCNKIGTAHRDSALQLVARLLEVMGINWGLKFGPSPRQFLLLLVNLACVEVRMRLEDKTLDQALETADILVACYSIVELFITFMTSQSFLDFDSKQREQAYCALKGAVGAILSLFLQVSEQYADGWTVPMHDRRTEFICASIRILGSWLSEETTSMKEEVCAAFPFVLRMCANLFEKRKAGDLDLPDPLRFMLPAFCHLAAEDKPRKIMLEEKLHELLFDYLQYQWGIFSRWLAKQPLPAADWLHVETTPEEDEKAEAERPDSEPAIILTAGIYMNLAVLEQELVSTDPVFPQILKFCITNVPSLVHRQDFLVLLGNLAVLGLLLLRHHTWKYANGDSAVFKFIQGTVSFLWDAHNSEESCDSLSLVISLGYKKDWPDLAEMWFLGMQGLSNVLTKLDWVVEFIIDSGWPQEIMKSLARIIAGAIDANTRTAYEDFLCCLIRAQPAKAKAVILENRGRHTSVQVEGESSIFTLPEYEIIIEDEKLEVKSEGTSSEEQLKEFEEILKSKAPTFQNDDSINQALEQSVSTVQEDKMFLKFKERISSYPDQVLRYGRKEEPLWVSDLNKPTSIPNCEHCGSLRKLEFQIMPQMLNYLNLDNVGDEGVDWGTLLIYVCENNCDDGPAYKKEFLWKQDFSGDNCL
nr:EOG090X0266 [Macrothrix elegans]